MLARIKFTSDKSNSLSKQDIDKLQEFLGEPIEANQMKLKEDGGFATLDWRDTFDKSKAEKDTDYRLVHPADMYRISDNNSFIVELEKFTSEFPNLEITIKGLPKAVSSDYTDVLLMMNQVSNKIEEAKNRFDKVVEFNQKCDVHVPGLGLLNLNRLAFATDYCTEELQGLLHKGWRIIAVCPQPDQRRPDYILGMNVADIKDSVEVEHFAGTGREGNLKEYDKSKVSNY